MQQTTDVRALIARECAIMRETLEKTTPSYVDQQRALFTSEAYTASVVFRLKSGHSFFYYHQECGNPGHRYDDVLRADCAQEAVCSGCGGSIHEAPKAE
jgi:hypothetical protein